jgi:hypothetical protein
MDAGSVKFRNPKKDLEFTVVRRTLYGIVSEFAYSVLNEVLFQESVSSATTSLEMVLSCWESDNVSMLES